MSIPSSWPLASHSSRFVVPKHLVKVLGDHRLSKTLYVSSLGHYQEAVGHSFFREIPDDYLVMLCTQGRGEVSLDGQVYPVSAGDLVMLPRGIPHRYQASKTEPWSLYWVHFDGLQADELTACLMQDEQAVIKLSGLAKWVARFEALLQVQEQGFSTRGLIQASSRLYRMLVELALAVSEPQPESQSQATLPFDLDALHAYLYEHIHEKLDLGQLATRFGVSQFHFARCYKRETGRTVMQAFTEMKIRYACQMLDFSDASIKSISYSLGISDEYYFSRFFKKTMGYSPRQYRKLNQQNGISEKNS